MFEGVVGGRDAGEGSSEDEDGLLGGPFGFGGHCVLAVCVVDVKERLVGGIVIPRPSDLFSLNVPVANKKIGEGEGRREGGNGKEEPGRLMGIRD